tara:strand:+ start:10849 stop:11364 length:516 start_codon:yes stop_codon:yes gene_type:complete
MSSNLPRTKPRISIVVAAAENNVIGFQGDMPWRVSADLKNFKAITTGKPIVMGRKTFDSIGRALPGRQNIVITRNPDWQAEGVDVAATLKQAVDLAKASGEIMIIGGGELYSQALPLASKVYLTRIHTMPEGDTWFPALPEQEWKQVSSKALAPAVNDTAKATFLMFERIK